MLPEPPVPQTLEEALALLRLAWEQLGQLVASPLDRSAQPGHPAH
ncbi:MAG TPA: hypothetical protein VFE37_15670 [Chloroflexota bacterium]|nr:hypothetical protein [Chloroflexota bacterium]